MYSFQINMQRLVTARPKHDTRPIFSRPNIKTQVAMSLSQRLKSLQMKTEPNSTDLAHWSLQSLENETVDFGKKNCGRSYMEVWNTDQEWVAFMVGRYSKSHNLAHRKFLRYVELMVQHHEEQQMPVVTQTGQGSTEVSGHVANLPRAKANVKFQPKAKGGAVPNSGFQEPTHFPLLDEELEEEIEMYNSLTMVPPPLSQSPEFSAMQDRMLNLENALTKVVNHLETQAMEQASQNHGSQ